VRKQPIDHLLLLLELCIIMIKIIKILSHEVVHIESFIIVKLELLAILGIIFILIFFFFFFVAVITSLIEQRWVRVIHDLLGEWADLHQIFQETFDVSVLELVFVLVSLLSIVVV